MNDRSVRVRRLGAGLSCLLAATLLLPATAAADLINGDFSDGFAGWDLSLTTLSDPLDPFSAAEVAFSSPDHDPLVGVQDGEVRLDPDDQFFELSLLQTDISLPVGATHIQFSFSYALSDGDPDFGDLVQVLLYEKDVPPDPFTTPPQGLLDGLGTSSGGGPVQRSLAYLGGATVLTLEIVIADFDFRAEPDFLSIGNFSFLPAAPTGTVPAPGAFLLLLFGLLIPGVLRLGNRAASPRPAC